MREMNRENGVAFIMVTHDDRLAQEADSILLRFESSEIGCAREVPQNVQ